MTNLTIQDVANEVNSKFGIYGASAAEELAGRYAYEAAIESGYADNVEAFKAQADVHLDCLEDAGARFDYAEALEYALELYD